MGFSDSSKKPLLLSSTVIDKDLSSSSSPSSNMANNFNGWNLSVSRQFQELPLDDRMAICRFDDRIKKEEEVVGESSRPEFLASLKVKLPAPEEKEEEMEEEVVDGLSTPTSSDHKIPALVCPPAPRKPKSAPCAAAAAAAAAVVKRNESNGCRKRVFHELTKEVESMFPEAVRADFGNKIKKARKQS